MDRLMRQAYARRPVRALIRLIPASPGFGTHEAGQAELLCIRFQLDGVRGKPWGWATVAW